MVIAENVAVIDNDEAPAPTLADETDKALAFWGDYQISALPAGYERVEYSGMGGSENPWAAYIYATWRNEAHERISLEYSYFDPSDTSDTDATAENPIDLLVGDDRGADSDCLCTDLSIHGLAACLVENADGTPQRLVWIDLDKKLAFHLSAEALNSDELIALAKSVSAVY